MERLFVWLVLAVFFSACNGSVKEKEERLAIPDVIFPLGSVVESENYTGKVWINELSDKEKYLVANLVFEPGCRNRWHYHPDAEQLVVVTGGKGFYQIKGEPVRSFKKGDVVSIPAGAVHWQGAAPDSYLVHVTVTDHSDEGHVVWLDEVMDEEYGDR